MELKTDLMRKVLFIVVAAMALISCGGGDAASVEDLVGKGDLKTLQERRMGIAGEIKELEARMIELDSAIGLLDKVERYPLVSTIKVKEANFVHYLELQGNVETKQNVLVYPEIAGTLVKVNVKEGQQVRKGQVLGIIDDGGMSSQLAQLKTQAELARTTYERQKRLWEQQIGSEIQYLQAKTNYDAATSAIAQAESQLGKSMLRAPFDGILDDVIKDQGTVVSPGPGSEIFRVVNLSSMYVQVDVPEIYLGSINKDSRALVVFPVLGDTIQTKVRQTGNFIDPGNRSFKVEVPVSNGHGRVKPNLTAKVSLNDYTNPTGLIIPQSIISENADGEQYVYLAKPVDDRHATAIKTIVTTGHTQGGDIEILSGIQDGDILVKEGARSIKDGQQVEIIRLPATH